MRYKLTIEYLGTQYAGWQRQQDQPSVQQALEEAVEKFCGSFCEVAGAGRTDAGVHALAQAAHVDLPKEYDPYNVVQGINFHLPHDSAIAVTGAGPVSDDFHARFSATKRHYLYRIVNRRSRLAVDRGRAWVVAEEMDISVMQAAAYTLVGYHDFTSFRDSECQAKSPLKTLDTLEIVRMGEEIRITTSARSFLHHQVRIMVGTLVEVGKGKWSRADVQAALDARDRKAAGPTASADGLYLVKVDY